MEEKGLHKLGAMFSKVFREASHGRKNLPPAVATEEMDRQTRPFQPLHQPMPRGRGATGKCEHGDLEACRIEAGCQFDQAALCPAWLKLRDDQGDPPGGSGAWKGRNASGHRRHGAGPLVEGAGGAILDHSMPPPVVPRRGRASSYDTG